MNRRIFARIGYVIIIKMVFCGGMTTAAPSNGKGRLEITRVGISQKSFNPSNSEKVTLSFEITKDSDVEILIYDWFGQQVKRFDKPSLKAGRNSIIWEGLTAGSKLAYPGAYLYVIRAKTEDNREAYYNPSKETGGLMVAPLRFTLDHKTGKIEYVLPKACMVRVRAGLKEGMYAKTLFDWIPLPAGRHTYTWDGMDATGMLNLLKHRELDVRPSCYTLPDNCIIVTGDLKPNKLSEKFSELDKKERGRLWHTKGKFVHYQHDPRTCNDNLRFKVLFPTSESKEGIPKLSGVVPVRIELDQRDAKYLTDRKFEIAFFVDGVYIYEIEEGFSPFTFSWDTGGFVKGPHIIIVNILGYDDHIGIVSHKVILGD